MAREDDMDELFDETELVGDDGVTDEEALDEDFDEDEDDEDFDEDEDEDLDDEEEEDEDLEKLYDDLDDEDEGDEGDGEEDDLEKWNDMFPDRAAITKVDEDQRMVWGWASVISKRGEPITDFQGDVIDSDELQQAAHAFVSKHRTSGVMHKKIGEEPVQVGEVVESMVFTEELQKLLGIDLGMEGWLVGVKVSDESTWQDIKKGRFRMFSIGGSAVREPIDDLAKARRKYPKGAPGGKGGQWMPADGNMKGSGGAKRVRSDPVDSPELRHGVGVGGGTSARTMRRERAHARADAVRQRANRLQDVRTMRAAGLKSKQLRQIAHEAEAAGGRFIEGDDAASYKKLTARILDKYPGLKSSPEVEQAAHRWIARSWTKTGGSAINLDSISQAGGPMSARRRK